MKATNKNPRPWWECQNCKADLREVGMSANVERIADAVWHGNSNKPNGGSFELNTNEQEIKGLQCAVCEHNVTQRIVNAGVDVYL